MHIEKNICEALLATLLEIAGKTKDTKKALLDLQDMDIRKDQHPLLDKGKYKLPSGLYKLSPEMKQILCNFLHNVKMLDGYASNIRRCVDVKGCKVAGLKSHDYHIIFQKLLPLVVRNILPTKVVIALIQLYSLFNKICSKELEVSEIDKLCNSIGETLCRLEMIFPPTFF